MDIVVTLNHEERKVRIFSPTLDMRLTCLKAGEEPKKPSRITPRGLDIEGPWFAPQYFLEVFASPPGLEQVDTDERARIADDVMRQLPKDIFSSKEEIMSRLFPKPYSPPQKSGIFNFEIPLSWVEEFIPFQAKK